MSLPALAANLSLAARKSSEQVPEEEEWLPENRGANTESLSRLVAVMASASHPC